MDNMLVASGEQSFLQLIAQGELKHGKYVCVTPCFRYEQPITETHRLFFMKVELIIIRSSDRKQLRKMIDQVHDFMGQYIPGLRQVQIHDDQYDILTKSGLELGSYGLRSHPLTGPWIYGTGLAEPRFSYACEMERTLDEQ
jgi:hypothetical protein